MKYLSKTICNVSMLFSFTVLFTMVSGIIEYKNLNDGWTIIGMWIVACASILFLIFLLIPFIYLLVKYKYKNMKFTFYIYLSSWILAALLAVYILVSLR